MVHVGKRWKTLKTLHIFLVCLIENIWKYHLRNISGSGDNCVHIYHDISIPWYTQIFKEYFPYWIIYLYHGICVFLNLCSDPDPNGIGMLYSSFCSSTVEVPKTASLLTPTKTQDRSPKTRNNTTWVIWIKKVGNKCTNLVGGCPTVSGSPWGGYKLYRSTPCFIPVAAIPLLPPCFIG